MSKDNSKKNFKNLRVDVAAEGDGNTQISASNLLSKSELEKALEETPYKFLEI